MLLSVRNFVQSQSGWKYYRVFREKLCKSSPFCFHTTYNHRLVGFVNVTFIHLRCGRLVTSEFRSFVPHNFGLSSHFHRQYCSKTDKLDIFVDQNKFDHLTSRSQVLNVAEESGALMTDDCIVNTNSDDSVYQENVFQNLQLLQSRLSCSDEKLASLVKKHPYLCNLEVLENIIEKVNVLLQYPFKKKLVYVKLKTLCNCLIYIDSHELSAILDKNLKKLKSRENKRLNFSSKEIQKYVGNKLAGEKIDNISYISELLNVQKKDLLKVTNNALKNFINGKYRPYVLKSKIDFLIWEGLTGTEIAVNLKVLTIPAHTLSARLMDMKATLGKISISVLCKKKSFHSHKRRNENKIHRLFGRSRKDLSRTAKNFLDDIETSTAYDILDMLVGLGISKEEIQKNVYIFGHKPENVTKAFQANIGQVDITTSEGQRMLLNLMIYDLEYGNNSGVY